MEKVITDYKEKTHAEMDEIWIRIKSTWTSSTTGIPGNTYYVFTGTAEADVIVAGGNYKTARDKAIASKAPMDEKAANDAMGVFAAKLQIIAEQVNTQQGGNATALASTGLTMAKIGEGVGQMDKAVINSIEAVDGITGRASINIVTSKKYCHGTYIQTQIGGGAIVETHSTDKHIIIQDGFVHGTDYMVRVCYDGTDKTRVWSEWFPFLGK